MMSKNYRDIILFLALVLFNGGIATAAMINPGVNDGNNDKSTETADTKTVTTPLNLNGKDWVIIEVIEEDKKPKADQVVVEKKNISQVSVTYVEVRSCQKNATPQELLPILKEIQQNANHRKIYMQEENGKKIWYISPEVPTPSASPADLTMPMLWQIKI